jgi:hypothetical protein
MFLVVLQKRRNKYQVKSDEKENKSEQALQIIGHVVAESYANKRSMHGRRQFVVQTLLYNKSYLMNLRRWNYNYNGENL